MKVLKQTNCCKFFTKVRLIGLALVICTFCYDVESGILPFRVILLSSDLP